MSEPLQSPKPLESAERLRALILSRPRTKVAKKADPKSDEERKSYEAAEKSLELAGKGQDIAERKLYAKRTFWLVSAWLLCVAMVIFLEGFRLWGFALDSKVVIALIGGTTTGIVGLFLVVTRYLFHR